MWPGSEARGGSFAQRVGCARIDVCSTPDQDGGAQPRPGRPLGSVAEMQAAWGNWLPTRREQVHRTHAEVIAARADRDRAALLAVPPTPYLVWERPHRRHRRTRALRRQRVFGAVGAGPPPPAGRAARDPRHRRGLDARRVRPPADRPRPGGAEGIVGSSTHGTGTGCPATPTRTPASPATSPPSSNQLNPYDGRDSQVCRQTDARSLERRAAGCARRYEDAGTRTPVPKRPATELRPPARGACVLAT